LARNAGCSSACSACLFVLTVFTVLALPINIVAGLFGMNMGGIRWSNAPHGFWVVTGALAAVMAVIAWWLFRLDPESRGG
jgi:zinc transporter